MKEKLRRSPLYSLLAGLYPALHKGFLWVVWQICACFPVDPKKIVFSNFNGGGFGDNPRYIAGECIRRRIPYKLYWVCERPGCTFPPELIVIRPNTAAFVYHMSTAGVWVDNTRKLYYFKKKKTQTYIHTWHAGPGLKRIERDAGSGLTDQYIAYAKRDSRAIDLLLSNCRFWTECFRSCFWYDGPIMEKGLPKNDLYFQDPAPLRRMIRDHFGLPADARLVLYVPTWRENRKLHVYHLDFEGCLRAFEKRFGGTWYMLVRMHPNVNAADFDIRYTDRILNASPYPNAQELLAAGDAVITDYSSCGFDYIQLDRPSFLYAEDYDQMKRDKGYYMELSELPSPVAFRNSQMLRNILDFSEKEYEAKRTLFMKKMDYRDDGRASAAVVDYILERSGS
ncbi:MAG: CDP-glycerol glycerophosphotransferase family protein [Eubacteriales bacterium]|nr:CDP-glycerol glycerophosphotransferase family protein [Eubacteriales bacterium]